MDNAKAIYECPLVTRNASRAMAELFSPRRRALAWRRVWLALAEAQCEMGLGVSRRAVAALRRALERIDLAAAARHERRTRHDVVAHLHAYADAAPEARGVLHLGATSMDVVDNADLLILRDALTLVRDWLVNVVFALADQARRHRSLACLGWTHYQPAQPTTLGKRAATWCWDFVRDLNEVQTRLDGLALRGVRGATGTQASFLKLCGGRAARVERLERLVARKLGFDRCEPVTGQTVSRKIDGLVVAALAGVAVSVHKFANDVRLLANLREVAEPAERGQVGSSAMPYKRNPMLCERATGLARFVIALSPSAWQTAAEQWLERTLDDSSNRRIVVPEAFLAVDGMLQIVLHVARGMVVHEDVIAERLRAELPFLLSEEIILEGVAAGGDRQSLHERLRRHALTSRRVHPVGLATAAEDFLDRLRRDPAFSAINVGRLLRPPSLVGLAPQQVDQFLRVVIAPFRRRYCMTPRLKPDIHV
jgi:adenylosuccinate lyase